MKEYYRQSFIVFSDSKALIYIFYFLHAFYPSGNKIIEQNSAYGFNSEVTTCHLHFSVMHFDVLVQYTFSTSESEFWSGSSYMNWVLNYTAISSLPVKINTSDNDKDGKS